VLKEGRLLNSKDVRVADKVAAPHSEEWPAKQLKCSQIDREKNENEALTQASKPAEKKEGRGGFCTKPLIYGRMITTWRLYELTRECRKKDWKGGDW